jgi:hypothetical protein
MSYFSSSKRKFFVGVAVALLLAVGGAIPFFQANASRAALPQRPLPAPDGERLENPPAAVRLSWEGLPDQATVMSARGTSVNLRIENRTAETLRATLIVKADDGGAKERTLHFGLKRLPPFGQETIEVDARRLGFDLGSLRFSGRLHATAQIEAGREERGEEKNYEPGMSPALFFHPINAASATSESTGRTVALAFYGKQALQDRFRAGDFRGTARELAGGETTEVLSRVIDAQDGNSDAQSFRKAQAAVAADAANAETLGREAQGSVSTLTTVATRPAAAAGTTGYNNCKICILFRIQTIDSAIPIKSGPNKGGIEDHWTTANEGIDVPAYGIHVRIKHNGVEKTYPTDPATGCFFFSNLSDGPFLLKAYGYASDSDNNFIRIHNAPDDTTDSYPGKTYVYAGYITPLKNSTSYYAVGGYDTEWTAMAAFAFSLYRYHDGLANKAFHVGMDNEPEGWSSAHFGKSNSYLTAGRHYLKIDNAEPDGGAPHTTRKSVSTHEFGHAAAALFYGSHPDAGNGGEPDVSLTHDVTPNACGTGDEDGGSYSIGTKEWSAVGFREGFATFVAAKIWNDKDFEGSIHWLGSHHDLERFSDGAGTASGGRLENVCCIGGGCADSWKSAGTNEDWLLFFWDFYTNKDDACSTQPTKRDMFRLYRNTRLQSGLKKNNYFSKMRAGAQNLSLPTCLKTTRFDSYATHNGINN